MTQKTVCLIIGHKVKVHPHKYFTYYCPRCEKQWEGLEKCKQARAVMEMHSGSTLAIIILVILLLCSYSCQSAAITDDFLNRVAMVESNGKSNAVGDGGKALGLFQFHKAAWETTSQIRLKNGLTVYPYSQSTNAYVSRLYAGTWFEYIRTYLVASGIKPTRELLLMCHQCGLQGAKRRNYDLSRAPRTVQLAARKMK